MDEYSSKRAIGGVGFSKSSSSHAFRDNHEDRSIQYCNRLGCSTRHSAMRSTQIANPEKLKSSRPAFLSSHSKAAAGKSSRTLTALNAHKKPQQERGNTSLQERVTAESSARQEQREDVGSSIREEDMITLEVDPPSAGMQRVLPEPENLESSFVKEFSINTTAASTECQVASCSRTRKASSRKAGSGNQVVSSSSSARHSVISNNVDHMVKHSLNQGANMQRHRLRNLSCTSITDVLPSGCSSSDVGRNKRTNVLRKRYTDGQSSSARSKGKGESLNGGNPDSLGSGSSGLRLSPLDQPSPQPALRRTRNRFTSRDGVVSVRTQRSDTSNSGRLSENVDANAFLLPEFVVPQSSQAQLSLCEATAASSSESFPTDLAPFCQNSSGRPGSSSRTAYPRSMDHSEDSSFRIFRGPLVDRDGYRYFNMEGIAEVLLALERIEQDEELAYEELMVLESNLFLGGTGFYDQHRDMRLDIDSMSYEELLALEEKIGTVSTALTEEALSKCLERSIYTPLLGPGITCSDDDGKCSICQEEYIVGDEVGKLDCDHRYHVTCVHQWLRQKNWCPICKSSACPS